MICLVRQIEKMFGLSLRVVPYDNFGVTLWSVEDGNGFTYRYCDTKQQALEYIANADDNIEFYTRTRSEA